MGSTVQDASIKEEIGYEFIMGVIDRHIDREVNWEMLTSLDILGVEEVRELVEQRLPALKERAE